jgi:RNA polymerase sigma-70 factor (ECF subfamily)
MAFSTDLFLEYKKRPGKPALARLLERHQDAVYSICRQVLRHPQDAEDACQEVLLEVSRQVDSIEEPDRFAGWLYRTALHTALDVKRKRGRQRLRDAEVRPAAGAADPSPDAAEALHRELARLDDTSRQLVVEHYFASRPLRELAAERGCSEVAVWKRIESARERLRKVLGSAAVSALDGIGPLRAPAGMAKQALLGGGLTMAASSGIKLAIVAPLILLAGAGVVMTARRSEPVPEVASAKASAPRRSLDPAGAAEPRPALTTATGKVRAPAPVTPSAPRRPYPLKLPGAAVRSQAAEHTWSILQTKRMTLNEADAPLSKILQRIAREAGIAILADPAIGDGEAITIRVQDIVLDGCLRLMLQPRGNGYEIRPDGAVLVCPTDPEAEKVREALQSLDWVREKLDGGWDGLRDPDAQPRAADELRAKSIVVPQGETSVRQEMRRLRDEHRVQIHGLSGEAAGGAGGKPSSLDERFLQLVEERTFGDHLDQLARRCGMVVVDAGADSFWMTTEDAAENFRALEMDQKRRHQKSLEILTMPLPEAGTLFVQDLLDSIPRKLGVELVPDQAAWESGASVTLPTGATLRDALDALKARGFRWALYRGEILVLK